MGLDGRSFWVWKFRSMYDEAERDTGPIWAREDDPRCTPVGRFLRRSNLDEIPQLWNVFCGDMSLVGPRPERPFFVEQFKQRMPQYMLRHKVKAGLTGWAQVNGWRGQHLDREADRVRPLLHRELVGHARPQDHVADGREGLLPQARVLVRITPMARVVITGAAGFIGSHLAEAFLDRGDSVVGVDNLLTGDTANIAHLAGRDFQFIKHDVTNYIYVDGPVDYVLHWASPASPIDYLELPIQTLKVGSLGHAQGASAWPRPRARASSSPRPPRSTAIRSSTRRRKPTGATSTRSGQRGVYDEAKRFAEAMTMAYHRFHQVDTKIVRIFNTYGPRMRVNDGRAVPAFMSQALRNEDVTIFGDGSQTRSFCYVSDLVRGIIKLMESGENDPVNIGNPHEMTIKEIAETIIRMTGSTSRLVQRPLPTDDPKVRKPDITRARTLLNWEPTVSLEEGLTSTVAYFRQKLGLA
jgi:dTDP-glucose 4,6-dehydratase